jgi:hypothetical protein
MCAIHDKRSLIDRIWRFHDREDFHIELGCGNRKRSPGVIGVDSSDHPSVDIVGDMYDVLSQLPAASVASVSAFHSLEHVQDLAGILQRIATVLKIGGRVRIVVPHFSNPYFYSDPTHRQFFGLYSLSYLAKDEIFKRRVPQYCPVSGLRITGVSLGFKSTPPFYGRHGLKLLFGLAVNSCRAAKELYEELGCWLFPCYEVTYDLEKYE